MTFFGLVSTQPTQHEWWPEIWEIYPAAFNFTAYLQEIRIPLPRDVNIHDVYIERTYENGNSGRVDLFNHHDQDYVSFSPWEAGPGKLVIRHSGGVRVYDLETGEKILSAGINLAFTTRTEHVARRDVGDDSLVNVDGVSSTFVDLQNEEGHYHDIGQGFGEIYIDTSVETIQVFARMRDRRGNLPTKVSVRNAGTGVVETLPVNAADVSDQGWLFIRELPGVGTYQVFGTYPKPQPIHHSGGKG